MCTAPAPAGTSQHPSLCTTTTTSLTCLSRPPPPCCSNFTKVPPTKVPPTKSTNLAAWCAQNGIKDELAVSLLHRLLEMDPRKRISARDALQHKYFFEGCEACEPSTLPGAHAHGPASTCPPS
jgi:serine/threonine protein kinase